VRLCWLTDVHLEFLSDLDRKRFAERVARQNPDNVLITGDIATAGTIKERLSEFQKAVGKPILYVLGNHDFYNGSIAEVRKWARQEILDSSADVFWMHSRTIKINGKSVLIGVDGWADGMLGNRQESPIVLSDWHLIKEMAEAGISLNRKKRLNMLKKLGKEEAATLRPILTQALAQNDHVYIATHVPPWKEAAWHEGELSDGNWVPWFTCKAVGDVVEELSAEHPGKKITVLCGHCFDDKTELLTVNGWRDRSSLNIGDAVVTLNLDTDNLEYNDIKSFADHEWNGDMCSIQSRNVDLLVTPGHGLVGFSRTTGKPKLFTAKSWIKGERVFRCTGLLSKEGIDMLDNEIRLAVWVAADGSFEHQQVRFHFLKTRKIERLSLLLDRMGIRYRLSPHAAGTTKIAFSNKESIIPRLFDVEYKQLPAIFAGLNLRQTDILFQEYCHTDGWISSKNGMQISSSKEEEIDLLQQLAVTANRRSSKLYRGKDDGFLLSINSRTGNRLNTSHMKTVNHTGHVWCATVGNGTLLVRRGGKVCVTQNTHSRGHSQISDDIEVYTGGAEYYVPEVQATFVINEDGSYDKEEPSSYEKA